jgi:hypothetical protein
MIRFAFLLLTSFLMLYPLSTSAKQLPPQDECTRDPDLVSAIAQLRKAVATHDVKLLLDLVAPKIQNDFGGDDGKNAFVRVWHLDRDPASSRVWTELARIMPLGCALDGKNAVIPYLFVKLDEDDSEFSTFVPVRPNVYMRAGPQADAPVVATLHWDIVKSDIEAPEGAWLKLHTDAGLTGYVRRDLLQAPEDWRLFFEKANGRWRIAVLIAGD